MTLNFFDVALRLTVAMICGGIIGFDRGKKRRAAGIRTHMIICMGSALTVILGMYLSVMASRWGSGEINNDVSRLAAQVISGMGFIGVGTIIITGKKQIKGLTTAAGLWASACTGLAIGAGFYLAAMIGCLFILLTVVVFSRLEHKMFANTRDVNIYVEFEHIDCVSVIIGELNSMDVKICDVDITKASEEARFDVAVLSLRLPKKMSHDRVITAVASQSRVRTVEEL